MNENYIEPTLTLAHTLKSPFFEAASEMPQSCYKCVFGRGSFLLIMGVWHRFLEEVVSELYPEG